MHGQPCLAPGGLLYFYSSQSVKTIFEICSLVHSTTQLQFADALSSLSFFLHFTYFMQTCPRSPSRPHSGTSGLLLPNAFMPHWLWTLAQHWSSCARHLDMVELFCGEGNLSAAFQEKGFRTRQLDRENGPSQDLGNMTGLRSAIRAIMALKVGALLWLGPPCKNWVFLSMPQHKRKRSNAFLGEHASAQTKEANSLVYIVAALVRLAVARGVHYIIEQPIDSRMLHTACMSKALKLTHAQTTVTYLAAFCTNFPCSKGLHLCGTAPILKALRRNLPSNRPSERVYIKDDFSGCITGGPDLEKTQHYPQEFGRAARNLIYSSPVQYLSFASSTNCSWRFKNTRSLVLRPSPGRGGLVTKLPPGTRGRLVASDFQHLGEHRKGRRARFRRAASHCSVRCGEH